MASSSDIRIVGVHPFVPTDAVFQDTLEAHFGSALSAAALEKAKRQTEEHFDRLYLIEIEIDPPSDEFDWCAITQPVLDLPRSEWQVPYDEQPLDDEGSRWAFFFHSLDAKQSLHTPRGLLQLPSSTPLPSHLNSIEYFAP